MVASWEQFDKPYRRGLVLGLSLAELFLILLFLLLLVAAVLETEKRQVEELRDKLMILETEKKQLETEKRQVEQEAEKLRDKLMIITKETEGSEIQIEDFLKLKKQQKELNEKIQRLKKEKQQLNDTVSSLSNQQGQDPPCWYVTEKEDNGETRQRHVKIFDVRISDDYFFVNRHDNSGLKQRINKGNQTALPVISADFFDRNLSAGEFEKYFKPYDEAGRSGKIRDYSCRFMVDVFDETSANNKAGYKKNLRTVERIFYKYEVQDRWKAN